MDNEIRCHFIYFNVEYVIKLHDWIIENTGGLAGVKDIGLIESPIEHIQNDWYYPELEDKLTHLVYSISKNHAFHDGNKRSSIGIGSYFLELNGFDYLVSRFVIQMEDIIVYVAGNKVNKELLKKKIYSILYEDDYSEDLKLELLIAVQ